jgi:hypothetical protein
MKRAALAERPARHHHRPGDDVPRAVPLLSGVPGSTIHAVHARGVWFNVAAGE